MGCHVSVLSPGRCPHPPHSHVEEELLIILDGEANVEIASSAVDPSPRVEALTPRTIQLLSGVATPHHSQPVDTSGNLHDVQVVG